ncbi:MAG: hypothetical protein HOV94_22705 [Saccharothrix sp.]|nr:hypothetical protein [Saccharothrix sp.]
MDEYVVQSAEKTSNRQGQLIWLVSMLKPDGTIHCHAFPPSAVEWRMAEYQLGDVDEALDIVLHEPFATNPADPLQARDDAAVRVGMVVRAPGRALDYEPITLHSADTIKDARDAHRIRISDAKTRVHVKAPKGKPDPLDAIRQYDVTDEGLRQKAALVDAARRSVRGEAPTPQPDIIFDPEVRHRGMKEDTRA